MWGWMYFQNGVSSVMEQLIFFHDHSMTVLIGVMGVVGYLLGNSLFNVMYNRGFSGGQELESVWTVVPGLLLLMVAFPSLRLLYFMEEGEDVEMSVKVVGFQWYWMYEYSDLGFSEFGSYMRSVGGWFRLGEVDNCLILPFSLLIRVIVTSFDVIHAWTLPSVGVKTDAVPGRLNQLGVDFKRPGVFVGQCSEICGANHSFMPVVVGVVSRFDFLSKWV